MIGARPAAIRGPGMRRNNGSITCRKSANAGRYDLQALALQLQHGGRTLETARREDILHFLAALVHRGRSPRSLSRYLSGFRQFYQWLLREGSLRDDPSALIESPRVGRGVPKALSEPRGTAL